MCILAILETISTKILPAKEERCKREEIRMCNSNTAAKEAPGGGGGGGNITC